MHTVTLRTVGGSVMFAIPKPLLEGLGLAPNTEVGVSIEDGRLVVVPQSRPRYRLAELLAECDSGVPQDAETAVWTREGPVGREAL